MSTIISKRKKKNRLKTKNKNSILLNNSNKHIEKVNDKWYNTHIVRKKQKEIKDGQTI